MATATDILTLTQWFSPAFPVGSFAYSHGLEWAIETGDVREAATAQDWIETVLMYGAGWNDSLLICAAHTEAADLDQIDATARAMAASRERFVETDLQGRAFCAAVRPLIGADLPDLTYPVAVGRAVRLANLPIDHAVQMYLQAFVSTLAGAAMRAVPLGQSDGQAIVAALRPHCESIAHAAMKSSLDDLTSTAFAADIAAMRHETQYSRMFRT